MAGAAPSARVWPKDAFIHQAGRLPLGRGPTHAGEAGIIAIRHAPLKTTGPGIEQPVDYLLNIESIIGFNRLTVQDIVKSFDK